MSQAETRSSYSDDTKTAKAFASSWNTLPKGSVYTKEQVTEWFAPVNKADIQGKRVAEFGCGNGSLMVHMAGWKPEILHGIDLGDSVLSAEKNMAPLPFRNWKVQQADITTYEGGNFDFVYCIGVLHHLKNPKAGLDSIIRNTKPGGRFHCWVYGREGNGVIVYLVDPIRKIASRLPWWFTKYCLALPLSIPFYTYAKFLKLFSRKIQNIFPLASYCRWIAKREFRFFWHVAFDQLVTPQTAYIPKKVIQSWLKSFPEIDQSSTYIIQRNGNSWKFGGRTRTYCSQVDPEDIHPLP